MGGWWGRGWCLEVPLFPPHANLQLPSSCPFLTRGLERTQDTPLPLSIPYPLRWVILAAPVLLVWFCGGCFLCGGKAPMLRTPELMFAVAQPKVWLASHSHSWSERLAGLPASGRQLCESPSSPIHY